mgnify:CR=1 FL=1
MARFVVGQDVCLRSDPSRQGMVRAVLPPIAGRARYRIYHGPGDIRDYTDDQLELVNDTPEPDRLLSAMASDRWMNAADFQARLTATRLANPQSDNLYALQSARIQFISFQFKPLLRFLRADRPRLLIADEVGVGKTIEAGLILKELQTRQRLENVLIVCPKALVAKWRAEMRRFDEDFRPLTGETLRYCLKEAHLEGAWPAEYARAIAHTELLRIDEYLGGNDDQRRARPGLLSLDPAPRFDLVIVDEAHHLRNPGTNSYELARFLCDAGEAVLFLSATPVHVGAQNLFALLALLRPDLFPDEDSFAETIEPNSYIFEAMRHIRNRAGGDGWQATVAGALEQAARTNWGRQVLCQDPRFTEWQRRFNLNEPISDAERIHCLRDLEETHSLAHVMNRTRRRDIARFTIREPHTVTVPFTPEQQQFYQALIQFRREMLLLRYDPRVVRLITDTLERQAASCLPALVPTIEAILRHGRVSLGTLSDNADGVDEEDPELPGHLLRQAEALRDMANNLPPDDPKLMQLLHLVRETLSGAGSGKVLLFSFFLHTLDYLLDNLRLVGYRTALVSGRIDDEERERLRARFRLPHEHPEAIDILLSSEVGCEGLDYEFCDRLVNYDIPWNPMRVEQRIGRIDRFGQQSDKVLIFNFVTPGTVEERIFHRCFERLHIFENTVGDLELVLGDFVQDLTRLALDPKLTPEQAEQRANQMADNILRQIEEQQRLEQEGGGVLGLDEAFTQDVRSLVDEGRFVNADDVRHMVSRCLEDPAIDGKVTPDKHNPTVYQLRLSRRQGRSVLLDRLQALDRQDRTAIEFRRWLEADEPSLAITFDQQTAIERRDLPFITPVHPLARIAVERLASTTEALVVQLVVKDASLPAGNYLFVCDLWETLAFRPESRLVGFARNTATGEVVPNVSTALIRLLASAEQREASAPLVMTEIEHGFSDLDESAETTRSAELTQLRERESNLRERRLASLDAYYRNRLRRVESELASATEGRIKRMKQSEQVRIERDYSEQRARLTERREPDILSKRIAAGILEIC